MKATNLKKFTSSFIVLLSFSVLAVSFKSDARIEVLSLEMEAKTLYQGKSVTTQATLYYKTEGTELITYVRSPMQQIVYTSALGEFKSYSLEQNTVMIMQGQDYSSKNSFIYHFLNGETNDMGLISMRYKMTESKVEDGLLINTWTVPTDLGFESPKVEVVYKDFLPIYMGFYGPDEKINQKTYYTNYQDVSFTKIPFTITEIMYLSEADSSITRRSYSNLKINGEVDKEWFEFDIPSDAKIITTEDVNAIFQSQ